MHSTQKERWLTSSCQENNAFVVVDIEAKEIVDILPLGYKDHSAGSPVLDALNVNELAPNWPILGTPVYDGGQAPVSLGGFSGLYFDLSESTVQNYVFYTVPDRGPNADPVENDVTPAASSNLRPYKLPDYQVELFVW
ncbi:MAG: hypothetical protein R2792_19585 [Saprospiraceae bacterium]